MHTSYGAALDAKRDYHLVLAHFRRSVKGSRRRGHIC